MGKELVAQDSCTGQFNNDKGRTYDMMLKVSIMYRSLGTHIVVVIAQSLKPPS